MPVSINQNFPIVLYNEIPQLSTFLFSNIFHNSSTFFQEKACTCVQYCAFIWFTRKLFSFFSTHLPSQTTSESSITNLSKITTASPGLSSNIKMWIGKSTLSALNSRDLAEFSVPVIATDINDYLLASGFIRIKFFLSSCVHNLSRLYEREKKNQRMWPFKMKTHFLIMYLNDGSGVAKFSDEQRRKRNKLHLSNKRWIFGVRYDNDTKYWNILLRIS